MSDLRWEPTEQSYSHVASFVLREPGLDHIWNKATVKWDGCVDYYHTFNTPFDLEGHDPNDVDYIHICDIDRMIDELTQLKATALAYFDTDKLGVSGVSDDEVPAAKLRALEMGQPKATRTGLIVEVALQNPVYFVVYAMAYKRNNLKGLQDACCQTGFMNWGEDMDLVDWEAVIKQMKKQAKMMGLPLEEG